MQTTHCMVLRTGRSCRLKEKLFKLNNMKTVKIGNNGNNYPMYQSIEPIGKDGLVEITLITENDETVNVGDKIEKNNYSWIVKSIDETRPAKGNHPHTVTFQRLTAQ